jgi:nucleotide-binding universal stress UspA family protein
MAEQGDGGFRAMVDARSILVPITGASVTLGALKLAVQFAQLNRGKVLAVHVIEVARHLPLEAELPDEVARAESIFAKAREALADRAAPVEFVLLQARNAGATLVDEAVNCQADAIMLGVADKHHANDLAIGSTADFVMRHAPCQVWLCRAPLSILQHAP